MYTTRRTTWLTRREFFVLVVVVVDVVVKFSCRVVSHAYKCSLTRMVLVRERGVFRFWGHYRRPLVPPVAAWTSRGGRRRLHSAVVASPRDVSPDDVVFSVRPLVFLSTVTRPLVTPAPAPCMLLPPCLLALPACCAGGEAASIHGSNMASRSLAKVPRGRPRPSPRNANASLFT